MYMGKDPNAPVSIQQGLASAYLGGTPLSERGKDVGPGSAYTSAAAKYAAPVAGVTAAGMALIDLTSRFGSRADYQEEGQLPM